MHNHFSIRSTLAAMLFPERCILCQRFDTWLCPSCAGRIPVAPPQCPVCRQPSEGYAVHASCANATPLAGVVVVAPYEHPIARHLVQSVKYRYAERAADPLAELLARRIATVGLPNTLSLVPIPLHPRRQRQRGFNQAELLCRMLSRTLAVPTLPLLRRQRYTTTQTALDAHQRRRNVAGIFAVARGSAQRPETVMIVDDVATTLSTLEEAARTLHAFGISTVWGAVIARGSIDEDAENRYT